MVVQKGPISQQQQGWVPVRLQGLSRLLHIAIPSSRAWTRLFWNDEYNLLSVRRGHRISLWQLKAGWGWPWGRSCGSATMGEKQYTCLNITRSCALDSFCVALWGRPSTWGPYPTFLLFSRKHHGFGVGPWSNDFSLPYMHTPYEYLVGFFWSLGKNIVLPATHVWLFMLTQTSIILEIEG